jgi:predicted alpha/beta-hydrolase family hydrolase
MRAIDDPSPDRRAPAPTPMETAPEPLTLEVGTEHRVSALLQMPPDARACLVLAHGAGAGMTHPFMAAVAQGLATRGMACLRYQFPYMERGSKRPDPPALAQATVRAAVAEAARRMPTSALFAGGKSFGGRMTSQAQAVAPLPGVRGLVFLGFPLHPAAKPGIERAAHLDHVHCPMLFLQGTRDELADLALMRTVHERLGERATLLTIDATDHSFHVPVRSGRSDAEVRESLLEAIAGWIDRVDAA